MKLYDVSNGFFGHSYVHVYVIAPTRERASELAAEAFEERFFLHPEMYDPTTFQIKLVCEDTTNEWVSEIEA